MLDWALPAANKIMSSMGEIEKILNEEIPDPDHIRERMLIGRIQDGAAILQLSTERRMKEIGPLNPAKPHENLPLGSGNR